MFRKMKFFSTSVVSLIIALLLFAVSSKAELAGSLKGFSMRATEEKWEYSGRIVLKNEQDNIVAKGNLINVEGFPAVKAEKGASFFYTANVEPIPKETYLKEPPEDFAIVKLMKTNRWLLKDSNFVFLLEGLDRLIDPYLEIAIDKSLARASIIILYEGTFSLWGYTVTIGEEGGNVKFRHGKIIDGLNAVIKGIDEETLKFPKKQEKEQEDVKISQKERAVILHRIKKISLSVEIDSLLKVELEGPYASLQAISSKDVPEKRQQIEKWLLQILKTAFERAGYKVVGEKQDADARLLAQYDEAHVMTLEGKSTESMFIFYLKLVLTHLQYGELFSTKLSARAINAELSDAIITGKDIVIVGIAPSEEIKNATLKDLQNKLPFK